jgi:protein phosphatase 1 regulatory subunit 7
MYIIKVVLCTSLHGAKIQNIISLSVSLYDHQTFLQSNRLTKIENLDSLTRLDQLYLSENGLMKIEGLDRNLEISTLDLANNKIRVIENIQHLSKLEELWVR